MRRLRRKRDRQWDTLSRKALRTFLAVTTVICAVATTAIVLTSRDNEPDLFDLTPRELMSDGRRLLSWPELERAHSALKAGGVASGSLVRALGYMTSLNQAHHNGEFVDSFVVVPELGHGSHPAPRFGDQMIQVRLDKEDVLPFQEGKLLWVAGTLRALPGSPGVDKPLYELAEARVQSATRADIPKYFH